MKIRTEKHIGPNGVEWTAVDDDSYDGAEDGYNCMGTGYTEQEAIEDLHERIDWLEWLRSKSND